MRSVEGTIQHLIGSGFDPQLRNHPYHCFVYTSFQERATKLSHKNTAQLASSYGDEALGQICGAIAVRSLLPLPGCLCLASGLL